jgi:hypothetical protein
MAKTTADVVLRIRLESKNLQDIIALMVIAGATPAGIKHVMPKLLEICKPFDVEPVH